jgi:hypothetical protein
MPKRVLHGPPGFDPRRLRAPAEPTAGDFGRVDSPWRSAFRDPEREDLEFFGNADPRACSRSGRAHCLNWAAPA